MAASASISVGFAREKHVFYATGPGCQFNACKMCNHAIPPPRSGGSRSPPLRGGGKIDSSLDDYQNSKPRSLDRRADAHPSQRTRLMVHGRQRTDPSPCKNYCILFVRDSEITASVALSLAAVRGACWKSVGLGPKSALAAKISGCVLSNSASPAAALARS